MGKRQSMPSPSSQAISGLLREGGDFTQQDEYAKKQAALEQLAKQMSGESQAATQNAGAYSAMGKSLDAMSAPTMRFGNAMLGIQPKNYGNAEGILNAYQEAKAKGAGDKLKNLLDTYKLANEGAGVSQKFGEGRTNANKSILNAFAAMMQNKERIGSKMTPQEEAALRIFLDRQSDVNKKAVKEELTSPLAKLTGGIIGHIPTSEEIDAKIRAGAPADIEAANVLTGEGNIPANKSTTVSEQSVTTEAKPYIVLDEKGNEYDIQSKDIDAFLAKHKGWSKK